jgi:hypothetical protein
MTFKRPIQTLENRIERIRTGWELRNPLNMLDANMIYYDQQEIKEHERAIEYLKQIIHVLERT